MKQKSLLKTMLLLFALVAGSSSVWATDVTINFGTTSGYWAAHDTSNGGSYTDSDSRVWSRTFSAGDKTSSGTGYSQFGNSSNACTSLVLTATAGSDMTVTAFSVKMAGASGSSSPTTGTIYLYKRTSGGTETQLATASVSGTADVTCSISSSQSFSSTDILKVSYVGTAKAIRIKQLSYSYTAAGGGGGSTVSTPSFSNGTGTYTTAQSITLSCATDGATIYYTKTEDGTTPDDPTESDNAYSAAISVTKSGTIIKAKAFKDGSTASSVATATYTIKPDGPTFSLDGGSYMQGTTFTLTSAGNTIYYTNDGTTPTTSSTEYTGPVAIAVGKLTYKAIAVDTYGNESNAVTRTYTGLALASLPFNWYGTNDAGKEDLSGKTGTNVNLASDYATSNAPYRLKFDGTSRYVIIYTDEKPEAVSFTAKLFENASTGTKMKVQASANGIDFTDIEEFTIKGSANATFKFKTTNAFAATDRAIKLAISSKDKNVAVGSICVFSDDDISVPLTDASWASFSSASALDFTGTGVTAYIAKSNGGTSSVTLTEIAKVPASTGIVVNAPAGIYAIPVLTGDADATTGNLLKPWLTAGTPGDAEYYTLAVDGSNNPKFKKSSGGTLAAGKAYLVMPGAGAPELGVDFGGTTGINAIQKQAENGEYYNLAGQRVAQPTKGLYIVNGKKVIIK